MNLVPETWCRITELLDQTPISLFDGSLLQFGSPVFRGCGMQTFTGTAREHEWPRPEEATFYHYLLLTLQNASLDDLDEFPDLQSFSARLLREQQLHLPKSRFAYDVLLSDHEQTFYSEGAVCVCMTRVEANQSTDEVRRKSREVTIAHRRGLLDDDRKTRADIRIRAKPVVGELEALRDSDYLPDDGWQVDVLFADWFELVTGDPVLSPLRDKETFEELQIQFRPRTRHHDFRMSDLFRP